MNIANIQFQKKARRRTKFLALALAVWGLGIVARLFQLQVLEPRQVERPGRRTEPAAGPDRAGARHDLSTGKARSWP